MPVGVFRYVAGTMPEIEFEPGFVALPQPMPQGVLTSLHRSTQQNG